MIEESDDEGFSEQTPVEERKQPRQARKGQASQNQEYDRSEREIEKREFKEPYFQATIQNGLAGEDVENVRKRKQRIAEYMR